MAKPTTLSAAKLLIMIGDGAGPEVFTAPCGLTSRGINFSKETNDTNVPDCDDPDAPAWIERVTVSLSASVSGSGVLAKEALGTWKEFFFSTATKNCKVMLDGGTGWGHWLGAFHCTTFNVTGELGDKVQVEVELQNDGEIAWVDAS
jgi:predicted secreted protein